MSSLLFGKGVSDFLHTSLSFVQSVGGATLNGRKKEGKREKKEKLDPMFCTKIENGQKCRAKRGTRVAGIARAMNLTKTNKKQKQKLPN
jgi:hypothetical protein